MFVVSGADVAEREIDERAGKRTAERDVRVDVGVRVAERTVMGVRSSTDGGVDTARGKTFVAVRADVLRVSV